MRSSANSPTKQIQVLTKRIKDNLAKLEKQKSQWQKKIDDIDAVIESQVGAMRSLVVDLKGSEGASKAGRKAGRKGRRKAAVKRRRRGKRKGPSAASAIIDMAQKGATRKAIKEKLLADGYGKGNVQVTITRLKNEKKIKEDKGGNITAA